MYHSLTANVLSADRPSQYSEQLLRRLGIEERFAEDPELVLAALRGPGTGLSREYLFVLSELSFYHAARSQKADYYLAAAVYAYAFFLGRTKEAPVAPIDPRFRLAANLYNLGLAQGLKGGEGGSDRRDRAGLPAAPVRPAGDQRRRQDALVVRLPDGAIRLPRRVQGSWVSSTATARPASARRWPPSSRRSARGQRPRKRASGFLPQLKVPVTAFLRIEDVSAGIATGELKGRTRGLRGRSATHRGDRRPQRTARARAHGGARLHARGRPGVGHRVRRLSLGLQAARSRKGCS